MIFSEVYSSYFNTVAAILREAVQSGITEKRIVEIIHKKAFSESVLSILPALKNEEWLLLNDKGQTPIKKPPQMPLTFLQNRWLKALLTDPRIALFAADISGLEDIEPLFTMDNFVYFDRYTDGDSFTDESYITNFRMILTAIKNQHKLKIEYENRHGRRMSGTFIPYRLEYSNKDDKFRLIAGPRYSVINLARITNCELSNIHEEATNPVKQEVFFTFELTDERKALERVMLHFSDCRKETQRLNDKQYHVTIWHDKQDETEMLIRILAFGPMIKVISPDSFVKLIKERIFKQLQLSSDLLDSRV